MADIACIFIYQYTITVFSLKKLKASQGAGHFLTGRDQQWEDEILLLYDSNLWSPLYQIEQRNDLL